MFGRRSRGRHARGRTGPDYTPSYLQDPAEVEAPQDGPFDGHDAPDDGLQRLDLGSVRVPVLEDVQFDVRLDPAGQVYEVNMLTPGGQFTVTAFAAPRSARLWNQVRRELITKLEAQGARVREEQGHWGRELIAGEPGLVRRFVGVDGPRWLLRGVVAGPPEHAAELVEQLRWIVRGTIVVRGTDPMPAKAALPIVLPDSMAERAKQQLWPGP